MSSCCEIVVLTADEQILISEPVSELVTVTGPDGLIEVIDSEIEIVALLSSELVVIDESVGPQGPPGPPGPPGEAVREIYIQAVAPMPTPAYDHIWIETGVGPQSDGFRLRFWDAESP